MLRLGKATITDLAREAKIKRPTLYLVLEELLVIGLVKESIVGKQRFFTAVHPSKLLSIAKKQLKNLEKDLPEMMALYSLPDEKPSIRVLEGIDGVKEVYKEMYNLLHEREEALWLSRIDKVQEHAGDVLEIYRKTILSIEDPRVRELNYANEEGKKWNQTLQPLFTKHFQARLLPLQYELGHTEHLIIGNKIVMFSYGKRIFVTIIESNEAVKTYKAMFECLWERGVSLEKIVEITQ